MDQLKFRIQHLLFVLLTAVTFVQCASIAQPQGGPIDSLPPLIVSTTPAQRATNFNGKQIVLNFNEYVALKDQQKEFIMSPPLEQRPTLMVKGRSIQIDFDSPLDSNTTYRLDFGASIADNNEGNRLGNYAFVFSTGAYVDTLMMSGLVVDAQTRDSVIGAMIFYFDAKADSVVAYDSTMFTGHPQGIFRTDSSGFFLADILRNKDYRIYAMQDENGNQLYEAGTDYIAILDSAYNPVELPDFNIRIAPATSDKGARRQIDPPQIRFDLFLEEPVVRHMVSSSGRPERQKLEIVFNSRDVEILSFAPSDLDSTWLLRENGVKGDTVWYWIAPPTKEDAEKLKDTVRVAISYITQDSLWQPQVRSEELTFVHRIIDPNARVRSPKTPYADSIAQVKKAKKMVKRAARLQKKWLRKARKISRKRGDPRRPDSVLLLDSTLFKQIAVDTTQTKRERADDKDELVENPFGYRVMAANPLNPENHIRLRFDYPLRSVDIKRISLTKLSEAASSAPSRDRQTVAVDQAKRVETPEPFTVEFDSLSRRQVIIRANWKADDEYGLLIPDSVFMDIAFQGNDTLQSTFKVADSSKFGTVIFELASSKDSLVQSYEYILELQNEGGTTIHRIKHAVAGGRYKIRYLTPNTYRLRVTQDRNHNGEWDTGSLVKRRQPERVRIWQSKGTGRRDILAKENWDVAVPVDLEQLFEQP